MQSSWLFLILPLTLISLRGNAVDFLKTEPPAVLVTTQTIQPSPTKKKGKPPAADNFLISVRGIGPARLGMTLNQLKQKLGTDSKFKVVSPFMVDFDAIAICKSGVVQYYILYPGGTNFADSSSIDLLLTDNQNYRTAEGVGAGTLLKQAETVYGKATLFYNTQNESREQVRFANYSPNNLFFQPTATSEAFAGIYSSPLGEYNETNKFHDSVTIRAVLVGR